MATALNLKLWLPVRAIELTREPVAVYPAVAVPFLLIMLTVTDALWGSALAACCGYCSYIVADHLLDTP